MIERKMNIDWEYELDKLKGDVDVHDEEIFQQQRQRRSRNMYPTKKLCQETQDSTWCP